MLINWNTKTFNWFLAASNYTGYNKKLAQIILEQIRSRDSLCDMGCGMGLVDFELAPYIKRIECVDTSSGAVAFVNNYAKTHNIGNVSARAGDARAQSGSWDTVLALFFGKAEDFVTKLLPMANDRLIAVVHETEKGSLGPEKYRVKKCNTTNAVHDYLVEAKLNYSSFPVTLEYGQPFISLTEAADFIKTYTLNPPDSTVNDYLKTSLTETGRKDYPYYLPNEKSFRVFIIDKEWK